MVLDTQFLFTLLEKKELFCRLTLSDNIFQQLKFSFLKNLMTDNQKIHILLD